MPRDVPGGDSTVHVVGAGLPGLSAAMALVEAARRVTMHESVPLPKWRVVKGKRATFAATQDARRPGAAIAWRNLALAADWTATGLPATIEGAIRSGRTAARHLLAG